MAEVPVARPQLSPEEIMKQLKGALQFLHPPSRVQKLDERAHPLLELGIVRSCARSENPEGRALALQNVLNRAVERLGESPSREAARILLALDEQSKSQNVTERRRRASAALKPGGEKRPDRSATTTNESFSRP